MSCNVALPELSRVFRARLSQIERTAYYITIFQRQQPKSYIDHTKISVTCGSGGGGLNAPSIFFLFKNIFVLATELKMSK
jgi:hypothetical protein